MLPVAVAADDAVPSRCFLLCSVLPLLFFFYVLVDELCCNH